MIKRIPFVIVLTLVSWLSHAQIDLTYRPLNIYQWNYHDFTSRGIVSVSEYNKELLDKETPPFEQIATGSDGFISYHLSEYLTKRISFDSFHNTSTTVVEEKDVLLERKLGSRYLMRTSLVYQKYDSLNALLEEGTIEKEFLIHERWIGKRTFPLYNDTSVLRYKYERRPLFESVYLDSDTGWVLLKTRKFNSFNLLAVETTYDSERNPMFQQVYTYDSQKRLKRIMVFQSHHIELSEPTEETEYFYEGPRLVQIVRENASVQVIYAFNLREDLTSIDWNIKDLALYDTENTTLTFGNKQVNLSGLKKDERLSCRETYSYNTDGLVESANFFMNGSIVYRSIFSYNTAILD